MSQIAAQDAAVVDDNGTPVICPTLNHTGNQTARQDAMLAWYRNVLGQRAALEAAPPATPWKGVWTTNDHMHHRMGFFAIPGVEGDFSPRTPGVMHTAWEYDSIDDLLSTWQRLTELNINPSFAVDHGISFAIYYHDPDGNLVELLTDAYGDHARSAEAMRSPEVRSNPPGVPFAPAKVLAAREGGMSLEELHSRAYAGEFRPDEPSANINLKLQAD